MLLILIIVVMMVLLFAYSCIIQEKNMEMSIIDNSHIYNEVFKDVKTFSDYYDELYRRNCFVRQAEKLEEERIRKRDFLYEYALAYTDQHDAIKYANTIINASKEYNIDPFLIAAMVEQESKFNKTEVGTHMDTGPMQILPGTAKYIANKMNIPYSYEMLFEIETNIIMGANYYDEQVSIARSTGTFKRSKYDPDYIGLIIYNRGLGRTLREFKEGNPVTHYADHVYERYEKIKAEYENKRI
jgi:soluble lytic murein transglycosylase-like protein